MKTAIVETVFGKARGYEEKGVQIWKGIPYAKPPIGPLRFRPPELPEPWAGVKDCTQFGPIAWQPPVELMDFLGNQAENMDEDCLNHNIWTPGADGERQDDKAARNMSGNKTHFISHTGDTACTRKGRLRGKVGRYMTQKRQKTAHTRKGKNRKTGTFLPHVRHLFQPSVWLMK
ncbi:carboxylesterase family protein [Heyndrickxia coagulans]|uniref:carboxylesterase family protein n=1 Tax=Heyndrickxia coagulans TaxID=1398 RepID=UPI002EC30A1C|nr:carboxylesterase family protein [Heyndrickxia coagulans]